jgi:hypothetical protein
LAAGLAKHETEIVEENEKSEEENRAGTIQATKTGRVPRKNN